jgi:hypothetical protein
VIKNTLSRGIMLVALFGGVSTLSSSLFGQSTGMPQSAQNSPASARSRFFRAENRWQLQAVDLESETDTVSPETRATRNTYLKPSLAFRYNLITVPPGMGIGPSSGASIGMPPELPQMPNLVWLTAKFESFHVFVADPPTDHLIYTEENFQVVQIINEPTTISISQGDEVDAEISGGRVKKPDGKVASFDLGPQEYFEQPGHTYLIAATYDPVTGYIAISRDWDVSSGKLVPIDWVSRRSAGEGTSKLSGLTLEQAIQYLGTALSSGSSPQ